jgi:hypothetical protein
MRIRAALVIAVLATLVPLCAWPEDPKRSASVILVMGASGEAEFGSNFVNQVTLWGKAAALGGASISIVGTQTDAPTNDLARLEERLAAEPKEGLHELWLVLIGHGTFDGQEARFNLRGPDLTTENLASWLQPFRRPLAVIDAASCSAPFLSKLSATNRIILTATRSGHEQNYTRFGQYLAAAMADPEADLDQDGQVSLLEAFLTASRQVSEFYRLAGRLATEHPLLDDNGDRLGTPADWFRGLRAIRKPQGKALVDGLLAHQTHLVRSAAEQGLSPEQRARRDTIERAVLLHREKKGKVPDDEYYKGLEAILLELARFYESFGSNPATR